MEFKNLADVTLLEEVPEGASVLAATTEGDIVRVPGTGLGGSGGDAAPLFVGTVNMDTQAMIVVCDTTFDDLVTKFKSATHCEPGFMWVDPYGTVGRGQLIIEQAKIGDDGYLPPYVATNMLSDAISDMTIPMEIYDEITSIHFGYLVHSPMGYEMTMLIDCTPDGFELSIDM